MGSKNRYLILILLLIQLDLYGQENMTYSVIDSLTYSYYKNGEWNKLITLGQSAIDKNIDYKYLRERIGYAFFAMGDYYSARNQFEKALTFDSFDQFSLEYLYYTYTYTGKDKFTGALEQKLSTELRKALSVRPFKVLESFELEYNHKYANSGTRSNPQYFRLGSTTRLGYRLMLHQSYSGYYQVISLQENGKTVKTQYNQPEYYAHFDYNVSNHILVKTVYHHIHTSSGSTSTNGNLFLLALAEDLNRFSFEVNGSVLNTGQDFTYQTGIQAGYIFKGRSDFYLNGLLTRIFQQDISRFIYNQKAGLKVLKNMWMESNITFGRMNSYNDYEGIYVYNSYDPMIFRWGATMFLSLNRNIMFWANFSLERKEYLENSSSHYNKFSYLGGIKWKL